MRTLIGFLTQDEKMKNTIIIIENEVIYLLLNQYVKLYCNLNVNICLYLLL